MPMALCLPRQLGVLPQQRWLPGIVSDCLAFDSGFFYQQLQFDRLCRESKRIHLQLVRPGSQFHAPFVETLPQLLLAEALCHLREFVYLKNQNYHT